MLMETLTSEEFEKLKRETKTVVIPVGSVEAHGPHLPLATDIYTIYEVCKLVAEKIRVVIAPPLYYGLCRSTKPLSGTLSLKGEVLKAVLLNIISEFYRYGFKNFFILSGHAGGTHGAYLIDTAETFIEMHKDVKFFVADIYKLLKPVLDELNISENDSHAGEWETSLILYFKPELVKEGAFEDYPTFPKFRVVAEKEKYWSSGIWGNPLKASKEKGKILAEKLVEILVKEIELLEKKV
ncbi:MAG: Creatinine amidohydrolase/Fe-dependent FAPy formamide hydrolase [Thermodesulfobacterium sp.]|uniref:Creatinine amidohydrolase/Fe-dependent FAPy formamide hydrolase n=1 Tax=Candidatus Thermodesulfobacterium syntrophicum TaxID=3060442 RepID=A0AAE3P3V0_9BACT|nr:Creatinine amidohydrolase/Fe-dependent FAPy formamide hydrolase [Candidatus Thermodesulfobacterium syntrophicum]